MPNIGSVNVKVSATTGGLTSGLGVAAGVVKRFGGNLKGLAAGGLNALGSGLKTAGSSLSFMATSVTSVALSVTKLGLAAGAAAAGGIGLLVHSSMEALDANKKLAQSLGITRDKLTGYQHAAELSGVSSEELESALGKLTRKGISLEALADKMQGIADPTERAKLAFDILGKSGQKLMPLLLEGADGIRALMADGVALQGSFSDADVSGIEAANDAISRVWAGIKGVGNSIAVFLAPGIKTIADGFAGFTVKARAAFETITPLVVQFFNTAVAYTSALGKFWGGVFSSISDFTGITFTGIKDFIIDALIIVEFAFNNLAAVAALGWDKIKLGAISTFKDIEHLFSLRLPAMFTWLGNNVDVIFNTIDIAFENLASNVEAVFSSLFKWIKSGFQEAFNPDLKPLMGNAAQVAWRLGKLAGNAPQIADRIVTPMEKALADQIGQSTDKLGDGLGEHLKKRRDELLGGGTTMPQNKIQLPEVDFGSFEDGVTGTIKKLDELKGPEALQRGTGGAFSAIFKAMRGNPGDEMKKTAESQLREQTRTANGIEKLVNEPKVEIIEGDLS